MGGVNKGFQIDSNLAGPLGDLTGKGDQPSGKVVDKDRTGPLGDLTGRGDQPSGKVVHKDRTRPLGDLTGRGDQPSGKVVLLSSAERRQPARDHYKRTHRGVLKLGKRVSLESTLHYRR